MADLLQLLHMLQGGGTPPGPMLPPHQAPLTQQATAESGLLAGNPLADALFSQGYGPTPTMNEPQMEGSAHPGWEAFARGVSSAAEGSNFRPRNFGQGLAAGFVTGAANELGNAAQARAERNAEKKAAAKAAYEADLKAQADARKGYSGLAEKVAGQAPPKPEKSLEDRIKEDVAMRQARMKADLDFKKANGIPVTTQFDTPLTPEAEALLASQFANYGYLPARGWVNNPEGRRVFNVAAQNANANPSAGAADFAANKASMVALQRQLDAVTAFEATANRNAKIMLNNMKSIPDLNSPILNTPIRALSNKVLGNKELAAYNTARLVVAPEFAKILSNPNLSGVLTDNARREMEDVISGSATLAQMQRVFDTLKQDANNRRTEYQAQLDEIKSRTRGQAKGVSGGVPAVAEAPKPVPAGKMRVMLADGTVGLMPAGSKLPAGAVEVK